MSGQAGEAAQTELLRGAAGALVLFAQLASTRLQPSVHMSRELFRCHQILSALAPRGDPSQFRQSTPPPPLPLPIC